MNQEVIETQVSDLLSQMTLAEKIGQMTQPEKNSVRPGDVAALGLGSVLSGGGGNPTPNTPAGWAAMVRGFQEEALRSRLGIPLLYGVDAVHGHNNVRGATIFPHLSALGAAADGSDTALVSELGAAYVLGLQEAGHQSPATGGQRSATGGLSFPTAVLATPKHYLGDGATVWGTSRMTMLGHSYSIDQGDVTEDEAALREKYLPPYVAALEAGALCVMASFSSWQGVKMHAHRYLLTDVLKGELGLRGFIVSDWMAIDQIDPDFTTSVVTSINAGLDMIMVPYDYPRFIATLTAAVERGDVPLSRIDDAVARILRVKAKLGLWQQPHPDPALLDRVGCAEHRTLAREAARRSLVLLRDDGALPIREPGLIFIAGEAADDVGLQCGGWTIKWQGVFGRTATDGETILEGLKRTAHPGSRLEFDRHGDFDYATDEAGAPLVADVGLVFLHEAPYAEGLGDRGDLCLPAADVALLERVRARCRRTVAVLVTGRPLDCAAAMHLADAWVLAWWPGSEGGAVGDVLFGHYPFTGRLPF